LNFSTFKKWKKLFCPSSPHQGNAVARSIFPIFFQIPPHYFAYCHFVIFFSERKSGSCCSVPLHKQPDSTVFLQKSKQTWRKAKHIGDMYLKN